MKKSYWILHEVGEVDSPTLPSNEVRNDRQVTLTFNHCVPHKINDKWYWLTPLEEACRVFHLKTEDFLKDELIDALNEAKGKEIYPVITIEDE
jgi:hypothetical protein